MKRFENKVCIVTGAGQGIGRATARRLGAEGGTIVVADRADEGASRTLTDLHAAGVEAMKVLADLSTFDGARSLMESVTRAHGRIDVLVNNVGGTIWIKPFHLYAEDEVKLELERSLYPTLWCCLAALPVMMKQSAGSIVNVGSQSVRGLYRAPYAASKGGILALGKVLAMEYGRHGIRVNTVSPGGTDIPDRVTSRFALGTGVMAAQGDAEAATQYRREMTDNIRSQQTLKRRGTPEDQAAAIAFLASDDASFISGDVVNCSGGQS